MLKQISLKWGVEYFLNTYPKLYIHIDLILKSKWFINHFEKTSPRVQIKCIRSGRPKGTFLYIPGFTDYPMWWINTKKQFIQKFAPDHNIYMVQWGDFGSLYQMALATYKAITLLKKKTTMPQYINILGHSMGGMVAQMVCLLILKQGHQDGIILNSIMILNSATNTGRTASTSKHIQKPTMWRSKQMMIGSGILLWIIKTSRWYLNGMDPERIPYPLLSVLAQCSAITHWLSLDCKPEAKYMNKMLLEKVGKKNKVPMLVLSSLDDVFITPDMQSELWDSIFADSPNIIFIQKKLSNHSSMMNEFSIIQTMNDWLIRFVKEREKKDIFLSNQVSDNVNQTSMLDSMSPHWINMNNKISNQFLKDLHLI